MNADPELIKRIVVLGGGSAGFMAAIALKTRLPAVAVSAMMAHDRVFPRGPSGAPLFHAALSYHFENEKFVTFLEQYALAKGVTVIDDTVHEVQQNGRGVSALLLQSGKIVEAELFVD